MSADDPVERICQKQSDRLYSISQKHQLITQRRNGRNEINGLRPMVTHRKGEESISGNPQVCVAFVAFVA
jgi:hypothetical protein